MHKSIPSLLLITGAAMLSGCPAALSNLGPATRGQVAPQEQTTAAAPDQRVQLPYSIAALDRGGFTEFTIQNSGNSDLAVRPNEIAMLVTNSRQQVHYDPQEVIIDLPQDCRIPPGQSVTGRARYNAFPNTSGNRLVFNPGGDPKGRVAVVATIQGAAMRQ